MAVIVIVEFQVRQNYLSGGGRWRTEEVVGGPFNKTDRAHGWAARVMKKAGEKGARDFGTYTMRPLTSPGEDLDEVTDF